MFTAQYMTTQIAIINEASKSIIDDAVLLAYTKELQVFVNRDVVAFWGPDTSAQLTFYPKSAIDTIPTNAWQVVILDNSDQAGALGYHDLTKYRQPLSKVFAGTDRLYGASVSVTMSHELVEMLVDPYINRTKRIGSTIYALEPGDPVEADRYGYKINNILMSNFTTPAWYSTRAKGPYDKLGICSRALEILPGGYQLERTLFSSWKQVTYQGLPATYDQLPRVGSRRERRWRQSELIQSTNK